MLEFLMVYAWLIVPAMLLGTAIIGCIKFFKLTPPEQRWKKILEWLYTAVLQAENLLGPGTGPQKLHLVYTEFKEQFPILSHFIKYETFCLLVDKALGQMRIFFEQ